MSQIEFSSQKKSFIKYRVRNPGRIDFTPMVDLGFLLISFFIFTVKMNESNAMKLYMPEDDGQPTPVKCSASLTLSLEENGKIASFECKDGTQSKAHYTSLQSSIGLREILQQKQLKVKSLFKDPRELIVMIKPTRHCDYRMLVDVLDEMTINGITRYAIVEADE